MVLEVHQMNTDSSNIQKMTKWKKCKFLKEKWIASVSKHYMKAI